MSTDRRNAAVVVALIVSMTCGVLVLLGFENLLYPRRSQFVANIALTAEQSRGVDVEIACAPVSSAAQLAEADDVCLIYPDGVPDLRARGGHVRVIVLRENEEPLPYEQKRALLATLHTMLGERGAEGLAVGVAAPQAPLAPLDEYVREFLTLKGFLRK